MEVVGLEPTRSEETGVTIRRANQLLNTSIILETRTGIEPAKNGFANRCLHPSATLSFFNSELRILNSSREKDPDTKASSAQAL